jgi:hypothetical protein
LAPEIVGWLFDSKHFDHSACELSITDLTPPLCFSDELIEKNHRAIQVGWARLIDALTTAASRF